MFAVLIISDGFGSWSSSEQQLQEFPFPLAIYVVKYVSFF